MSRKSKPTRDIYIRPRAPAYPPKKHEEEPPKRFDCPKCGMAAVTVTKLVRSDYSGHATIKCGKCGLQRRYEATSLTDPVDVYGMLVDEFFKE